MKAGEPESTYAISALVDGEPGALPRVVGLTALRSVIIGGGLYVAGVRGARLYRGALAASTAVSVWIAVSMLASDRRRR